MYVILSGNWLDLSKYTTEVSDYSYIIYNICTVHGETTIYFRALAAVIV